MTPALELVPPPFDLLVSLLPFWLGGLTCAALNRLQNRPRSKQLSRESSRFALRSQVVHRSFEVVEQRTGFPVPQTLRDFYTAPGFLHIERFEAPSVVLGQRPDLTFIAIQEFLPLVSAVLDELRLPDSTWLPFARGVDGCIYFLPLEEYHNEDGPVYQFNPEMTRWERERGRDIRRISDSLRSFLVLGTRVNVLERGGRLQLHQ